MKSKLLKNVKKILSLLIIVSMVFNLSGFNSLKLTYANETTTIMVGEFESSATTAEEESTVEEENENLEPTSEESSSNDIENESDEENETVEEETEQTSETEIESTTESESITVPESTLEPESIIEAESSQVTETVTIESLTESITEESSTDISESSAESIDLTSESHIDSTEIQTEIVTTEQIATISEIVEELLYESDIATVSEIEKATASEIEIPFEELDAYGQITFEDENAATFENNVISLNKDVKLYGSVVFKNGETLDLCGYDLIGPDNSYALYVENNFTIINSSDTLGRIKSSNNGYPSVYLKNASVNLNGGNIVGADNGGDAVHVYNSDLIIDGAKIDGGIGETKRNDVGGNGGDAIIVYEASPTNKIDILSGIVRGGNGGNGVGQELADTGSAILVLNKSYGGLYIGKANTAKTTGGGRGGNGLNVKTNDFKSSNLTYEHFTISPGSAGNTSRMLFRAPMFGVTPPPESRYSLHNLGGKSYLTSLKDQRNTSLCFVFSIIAYAETNLLINYPEYARDVLGFDINKTYDRTAFTSTGSPDGEIDFAEMYLGQSIYSQPRDEFGNAGSSSILNNGSSWYNVGGDSYMLSTFLSSWRGIIVEDDYYRWHNDYNCDRLNENVNSNAVKNKLNEYTNKTELHLKSARAFDGRDFSNNRNDINNTLKNLIKSNNGVLMGIYINGGGTLPDGPYILDNVSYGNVHVYSSNEVNTSSMGHMMYIIGWDDNVPIPASVNNGRDCTGAFICKDSYSRFSLIPYDFHWCMKSSNTATEYDKFCDFAVAEWEPSFSNDENNYFYDGSAGVGGLRLNAANYNYENAPTSSSYKIVTQANYSSIANIYKVRNAKEKITAVNASFDADENVRVSIYNVNDNAVSGLKSMSSALASKEVSVHRGSNLIRFDTPVDVEKDDYIAVVIHKTNGTTFTNVSCEYDITDSPFNYQITEKGSSYVGDYANPDNAVLLYKRTSPTGPYVIVDNPSTAEQNVINQQKENCRWIKLADVNFRIKLFTNNYVELNSNSSDGWYDGGAQTKFYYPSLRASMSDLPLPTCAPEIIFDKYTTNPTGTGNTYTTNSAYHMDIASSLKLYAQYKNRARVTFDANGHGAAPASVLTDDNWKVAAPTSPTEDGYIFKYWYETDENVAFDFANTQILSDKTLKAKWDYVGGGGGGRAPRGGGGGGSGGGGGGTLPNTPNTIAETKIEIDSFSTVPVDTTINGAWTVDAMGKWHVNIVDLNGQAIELKNSWCSLASNKVVNNVPIVVVDYYYIGNDGVMLTGWLTDSVQRKFFLDTDAASIGKMVRGWKKIVNDYFYFDDRGFLLTNAITPDGFVVNAEGKWVQS